MSGSVTYEQANDLLMTIRTGHNDNVKTEKVMAAKAQIKHQAVHPDAIPDLFQALRIGILSSNNTLFQHCFSCLGHLVKRVKNQDPSQLKRQAGELLPVLVDKMGDSKEKIRDLALNPLVDLWSVNPNEVERVMKEQGFGSRNPRSKESSLEWLSRVYTSSADLTIKPYTGLLVDLLEDANDGVREKAKEVVVELFQFASGPAKADLTKSLQVKGVRKAIATYITDQINDNDFRNSTQNAPPREEAPARESKAKPTTNGKSQTSYITSLPGTELEELKPAYTNTSKELEGELHNMLPAFEGRESEGNWAAREKYVLRLRELLRGNAPTDYEHVFLLGIKSLTDGIMKAMTSLRTKLSTSGCQLVKDLFLVCGSGMDPMIDIMLPSLIKLCAGTKKITAEAGNVTTAIVFAKVSYHVKLLNHLLQACQDKNVQPRLYAAGWLRALLEAHSKHKSTFEHGEGLSIVEKCIKIGLIDANPGVREGMRATFWIFYSIWPEKGTQIMEAQDAKTKKLLEKDNPNAASEPALKTTRPDTLGRSATAGAPTRPSIKELLAAKRREQNAPKLESSQSYQGSTTQMADRPAMSAPLRQKLPPRPKSQMDTRSDDRRPTSPSSNAESIHTIDKGMERLNIARMTSPTPSSTPSINRTTTMKSEGSKIASQPRSPTLRNGVRASPVSKPQKRLTILEQLQHQDYKVRLEGIVIIGCLLAGRTPPSYENSTKMPSLPPNDQLAQALQNLLNDPNQEVVENALAPEILPELIKFVGFDQVVPKVLLLNEGETDDPRPDPTSSLIAVKELLSEGEAAELLFRVIQTTGTSGNAYKMTGPPGTKATSYTVTQKKKILHGALSWMNDLVKSCVAGQENYFLEDEKIFRTLIDRLVPMLSTSKEDNHTALTNLLGSLHQANEGVFDERLATFDAHTRRSLKRAWGMSDVEDRHHEQVADVRSVLGVDPSDMISQQSARVSRRDNHAADEELTMINPLSSVYHTKIPQPTPTKTQQRPVSPPDIPDLPLSSMKRPGTADREPAIKVYQDPINDNEHPHMPSVFDHASTPSKIGKPKLKSQTSTTRTPEQHIRTLQNLLKRIETGDIDTHGLRKLAGVVRDNPVRTALQESNGDSIVHHDIWNGGATFGELLDAVIKYVSDDTRDPTSFADLRAQALLVLKQLVLKASPYFRGKESIVIPPLITIRGLYPTQTQVATNIDELVDEYLPLTDTLSAISTVLQFLLQPSPSLRPQSCVLALNVLSTLIKSTKPVSVTNGGGSKGAAGTDGSSGLEGMYGKLGTVAVRSMDDEDPEVRRSCVSMCCEMRNKLGDDERLFGSYLNGLGEGHRNLLTYYFARSQ